MPRAPRAALASYSRNKIIPGLWRNAECTVNNMIKQMEIFHHSVLISHAILRVVYSEREKVKKINSLTKIMKNKIFIVLRVHFVPRKRDSDDWNDSKKIDKKLLANNYLPSNFLSVIFTVFSASLQWLSPYESRTTGLICLFVCPSHFVTPFNGLFAPISRSSISNFFRFWEYLGKTVVS